MAGKQAKTLSAQELGMLLEHVRGRRDYLRSRVIVLLSFRAGLRAAEICGLDWPMILDASGKVGQSIELEDRVAKKRSGRTIPLHPELRTALVALLRRTPRPIGPVVRSRKGGALAPNSLVNWFKNLYREIGLKGCSSHSGRRTFASSLARNFETAQASVFDLRDLLGHASVETTKIYVDSDSRARRRLISSL
jgi:integrase/recombinase XerD